jgi:hypothetical protein
MINVPERDGLGAPFCEDAHFFVRTLEKGAHLRRNHRDYPRCALSKTVRIFEGGAHLRTRAPPWTRCRRRVRAVTGFGLVRFVWNKGPFFHAFILNSGRAKAPAWAAVIRKRSLAVSTGSIAFSFTASAPQSSLPQALRPLSRFVWCGKGPQERSPQENKKSRTLELGTAPHQRDLQLVAVPSFSKYIMRAAMGLVQDQSL